VVVSSLLLLAGCTAAPPIPEPTPEGSPSAIPDVRPLTVPPLACDDLVADPSAIVGTPVEPSTSEVLPVAEIGDVMYAQAGVLRCIWGGEGRTEAGYGQTLVISVAGDARDAYEQVVGTVIDTQYTTVDTAGDRSQFSCNVWPPSSLCFFDMLIGEYWVGGVAASVSEDRSEEEWPEILQALLEELERAFEAAGEARPTPVAAAGAFSGEFFCTEEAAAAIRQIFGAPDLNTGGHDFEGIYGIGLVRSGLTECTYFAGAEPPSPITRVSIDTIPGASWAVLEMQRTPPWSWYYGDATPEEIPGVGTAMVACTLADCVAYLEIGGSFVAVSVGTISREDFVAKLALVAELAAA
jgi:hypothetical protein